MGGHQGGALPRCHPGLRHRRGARLQPVRHSGTNPPGAARRSRRTGVVSHQKARGRRPVQRARELHLHDTAPPLGRLDFLLDSLSTLVGTRVRLWRYDGRTLRLAGGGDPGWVPAIPTKTGLVPTPSGESWLEPLGEVEGFWVETTGGSEEQMRAAAHRVIPLLGTVLDTERQRAFLAEELA